MFQNAPRILRLSASTDYTAIKKYLWTETKRNIKEGIKVQPRKVHDSKGGNDLIGGRMTTGLKIKSGICVQILGKSLKHFISHSLHL